MCTLSTSVASQTEFFMLDLLAVLYPSEGVGNTVNYTP